MSVLWRLMNVMTMQLAPIQTETILVVVMRVTLGMDSTVQVDRMS